MDNDTAQAALPSADPVADAAAAFRSLREPEPAPQARDEAGRFASQQEPQQEIEAEPVEAEPAEVEADPIDEVEAADEAQPDPVKMPASWSKDDAEHWNALPAETQALIGQREAQRETAVNSKFQEAANARKASEGLLAEANANRDAYAEAIQNVLAMVSPVEPDPRDYGAGTGQYNREAFDLAHLSYRQQLATVDSLKQQREAILAQQNEEAQRTAAAEFAEIEERARPALLAAVPDLADREKSPAILGDLVKYAISQGVPESVFAENADSITSAELLIMWQASQWAKLQEAKSRVAPKAKTAAPPVRPGVSTPRATQQSIALQKDMKRLAESGSVEDGAAIFRHFR